MTVSASSPADVSPIDETRVAGQDAELERRIVNFLFQRYRPALRHVSVDVARGCVALRGSVNSFYEKQLCLNCCQRVAGVVQIDDRITVQG